MTNFIDKLILEIDKGMKFSTDNFQLSKRPYPAADKESSGMNEFEKNHSAGLIRVNHSGEVCAQALYRGQKTTAKLDGIREQMEQAANEEIDHLAWLSLIHI